MSMAKAERKLAQLTSLGQIAKEAAVNRILAGIH
jgi:hypothetical protein